MKKDIYRKESVYDSTTFGNTQLPSHFPYILFHSHISAIQRALETNLVWVDLEPTESQGDHLSHAHDAYSFLRRKSPLCTETQERDKTRYPTEFINRQWVRIVEITTSSETAQDMTESYVRLQRHLVASDKNMGAIERAFLN